MNEIDAEIQKIEAELIRRDTEERYKMYVPTGKGEEFLYLAFGGQYLISLFSAANGIGKSALMMNAVANLCFPCGNPFFQQPLLIEWKFLKRIRIVSDPTNIEKNIVPELKAWFPKGRYKGEKRGRHYECYFKTDTGWTIDIMSTEQDPKEFESVNLGLIWIDEPVPESIYKACVSRLRMGGTMIITATPLTGSAWMYDKIVCGEDNEGGYRTFLEADVWSASKTKGIRGFLDDSAIEKMIAQYDDEDKQARVYGKFQHLVGMVFKAWNRKVHVIAPFKITKENYTVYECLDPHRRTENAIGWYAVDRHGRKFVIDEYFQHGDATDIASASNQRNDMYRVVSRRIDPWATKNDQIDEFNLNTRLGELGVYYEPATKARASADKRIQEALKFVKEGEIVLSEPELYVFSTCMRHIYEMEHYRWDDWSGKASDRKGLKDTPIDKDDHMVENLGRFLIQEPKFFEIDYSSRVDVVRDPGGLVLDPY